MFETKYESNPYFNKTSFYMSSEDSILNLFCLTHIDIRYWPGMPKLEQISKGNWIDLYTREELVLHAGDFGIAHLGVAMKLPKGYEAYIAPRSSTFKRWGIIQTNSVGIIDNSYCGNDDEWGMPFYATRDITIPKHTRLCQFRVQEAQPNNIILQEVEHLGNKNRGGFGSTGTGKAILDGQ